MTKTIFIICSIFLFGNSAFSQSPYNLSLKKEAAFVGSGLVFVGLGAYLQDKVEPLSEQEIAGLMKSDINKFDAVAIGNNSEAAKDFSDVIENGGLILPLVFLAGKDTRSHFGQIALMFGEVYLINKGLTTIAKTTFQRSRPFVYDPTIALERKQSIGARSCFFSGHTSGIASQTFFAAKVFSDFYPNSKWKPVVWGGAVTVPALMGYLRVRASRHYPTDVIGGYIAGAAIGYLVPHLHKNKALKKNGLSLNAGTDRVHLTWNFNRKSKYQ
jgi:membrane-associated phospholipid phosphatase